VKVIRERVAMAAPDWKGALLSPTSHADKPWLVFAVDERPNLLSWSIMSSKAAHTELRTRVYCLRRSKFRLLVLLEKCSRLLTLPCLPHNRSV
jgi:hypothetical protein